MWSSLRASERYARCSNISCVVLRASCKRRAITSPGYCVTFAFTTKEYHSTTASSAPERTLSRTPNPIRRVVTLDPTKLNAVNWKDWSGKRIPRVWTKTPVGKLERSPYGLEYYNGLPRTRYLPYPPHTRGFLYYHPPNSDVFAPEFNEFDLGHIRFRCVASPETPFHAGEDLKLPTGAPWHCSGRRLASVGSPLLNLALCEGLISEDDAATWSRIPHHGVYRNNGGSRYIQRFDQPFITHLAKRRNSLVFAPTKPCREKDKDEILYLRTGVNSGYEGSKTVKLVEQCFTSGAIVCHFEVHSFDGQGRPSTFALRVDRVLEPPVQVPSLPVTMPNPTPGELLLLPYMHRESGYPKLTRKYHLDVRPWTLKLDSSLQLPAIQRVGRRLYAMYEAQYKAGFGATEIHTADSPESTQSTREPVSTLSSNL
ncbi:hypothetical protein PENSPDRAFT_646414 [Peniophora sp. CONT]|nr:hypothetical protein PENSPDRAFT_646414 [Peniophora sp. CONT]